MEDVSSYGSTFFDYAKKVGKQGIKPWSLHLSHENKYS